MPGYFEREVTKPPDIYPGILQKHRRIQQNAEELKTLGKKREREREREREGREVGGKTKSLWYTKWNEEIAPVCVRRTLDYAYKDTHHISIFLSTPMFIYLYLSFYFSLPLSVSTVYLSLSVSIHPFVFICPYLSTCLFLFLSALSVCFNLCLSGAVCLSLSLCLISFPP